MLQVHTVVTDGLINLTWAELNITCTLIHLPPDMRDFRLLTTELMFLNGTNVYNDSIKTVGISIVNDSLVEGTETFVISGSVTPPAKFLPGRNMNTITIIDDERKCRLPLFNTSGNSIL